MLQKVTTVTGWTHSHIPVWAGSPLLQLYNLESHRRFPSSRAVVVQEAT